MIGIINKHQVYFIRIIVVQDSVELNVFFIKLKVVHTDGKVFIVGLRLESSKFPIVYSRGSGDNLFCPKHILDDTIRGKDQLRLFILIHTDQEKYPRFHTVQLWSKNVDELFFNILARSDDIIEFLCSGFEPMPEFMIAVDQMGR